MGLDFASPVCEGAFVDRRSAEHDRSSQGEIEIWRAVGDVSMNAAQLLNVDAGPGGGGKSILLGGNGNGNGEARATLSTAGRASIRGGKRERGVVCLSPTANMCRTTLATILPDQKM